MPSSLCDFVVVVSVLILLSVVFCRFLHIVPCISISLWWKKCFIVCVKHSLLIYSSADGHLGFSTSCVSQRWACINMYLFLFLISVLWSSHLGGGLWHHVCILHKAFQRNHWAIFLRSWATLQFHQYISQHAQQHLSFIFVMLETAPTALCRLGKRCTTELPTEPQYLVFLFFFL